MQMDKTGRLSGSAARTSQSPAWPRLPQIIGQTQGGRHQRGALGRRRTTCEGVRTACPLPPKARSRTVETKNHNWWMPKA